MFVSHSPDASGWGRTEGYLLKHKKDMARGLMDQARSSLESARQAATDGHWAYAVRTAQDSTELSLKALLLSAGTDPPKVHDLGQALRHNHHRLAEAGLEPGAVEEMAILAGSLSEDRSKAMYGDEERGVPPTELYKEEDARNALEAAEDVFRRCREALGLPEH